MVSGGFVDSGLRLPQNVFPVLLFRSIVPVSGARRNTARILSLLRKGTGHDFLWYKPGLFRCDDVLSATPSAWFDLIRCRMLLIYLEPVLQNLLLTSFHRALRPGGVLFPSPSETIGDDLTLFSPINRKWKLYRASSLCQIAAPCRPRCGAWAKQ